MKRLKTHSNFLSYVDTGSKVKQGSVLQRQNWPQPLGKDRSVVVLPVLCHRKMGLYWVWLEC